jgi:sec-independent protein translocase protein TatB
MFEVGFSELLLISALALIVLGPEKLPRVAAQVGRWVGRARAMARQFREQLEDEATLDSRPKPPKASAAPPATPAAAVAATPAPEKYYQPDDDTQRADVSHADAGAEPEPTTAADVTAPTDGKDERGA